MECGQYDKKQQVKALHYSKKCSRPNACGPSSGRVLVREARGGPLMADMSAEASAKTLWMGETRNYDNISGLPSDPSLRRERH